MSTSYYDQLHAFQREQFKDAIGNKDKYELLEFLEDCHRKEKVPADFAEAIVESGLLNHIIWLREDIENDERSTR